MGDLAPIGISTYSRINHLKQTVDALKKNTLAKESVVYIFSDAPQPGDEGKVAEVREYCRTISGFNRVHLVERTQNSRILNNRGGLKQLLDQYDRVIWLEEDIVTAPGFLTFMNQALDRYAEDESILSITGYCPPFQIPKSYSHDVYLLPRFNAWGFATWRHKFDPFGFNIEDFDSQKKNKVFMHKLAAGGEDIVNMAQSDYVGEIDALDVKVMYFQAKHEKYTLYPRQSLVRNIGYDGSGVHCGISDKFDIGHLWETEKFMLVEGLETDAVLIKANQQFRRLTNRRKMVKLTKKIGIYKLIKMIVKLLRK